MDYTHRNILVAGGASGMGLAVTRVLVANGWKVIAIGRRPEKNHEAWGALSDQYPNSMEYIRCDLINPNHVEALALRLPMLHSLVYCSGEYKKWTPALDPLEARQMLSEMCDLHAGGFLHLCLRIEHLIQMGGHILAISTNILNRISNFEASLYATSKGALEVLVRYLAVKLGPHITVNCVAPGLIRSPMTMDLGNQVFNDVQLNTPLGRTGLPHDIAIFVSTLIAMEPCWATGQTFTLDGGNGLKW